MRSCHFYLTLAGGKYSKRKDTRVCRDPWSKQPLEQSTILCYTSTTTFPDGTLGITAIGHIHCDRHNLRNLFAIHSLACNNNEGKNLAALTSYNAAVCVKAIHCVNQCQAGKQ